MADRRSVTVAAVVAWPVLVVSAMWAPADYVMSVLVVALVLVGIAWAALWWWGQSVSLWWETVKGVVRR